MGPAGELGGGGGTPAAARTRASSIRAAVAPTASIPVLGSTTTFEWAAASAASALCSSTQNLCARVPSWLASTCQFSRLPSALTGSTETYSAEDTRICTLSPAGGVAFSRASRRGGVASRPAPSQRAISPLRAASTPRARTENESLYCRPPASTRVTGSGATASSASWNALGPSAPRVTTKPRWGRSASSSKRSHSAVLFVLSIAARNSEGGSRYRASSKQCCLGRLVLANEPAAGTVDAVAATLPA
mmetsp:Transcript_16072/g.36000  ORF Transcript_16072/g.36000 Transcript_16072/m.36000 type:complete len:247 (+) Transcript_16072:539-1279(+)